MGARCARIVGGLPELVALALGLVLRLRLHGTYDPAGGYDAAPHWTYLRYVAEHGALPPLSLSREAYHPPLYYRIGGWIARHGGNLSDLQWISIIASCLGLVVFASGLRRHLPESRIARAVALAIAGVLPAAVHVAGMVTNEALLGLFSTVALVLAAETFAATGRARVLWAAALGLALGAALLTKVSAGVLGVAIAGGAIAEWFRVDGNRRTKAAAVAPILGSLVLAAALAAPAHLRHLDLAPSGFDRTGSFVPFLQRRSPGYAIGLGGGELFREPYWPTGARPVPRFWPLVLATSFTDYYGYGFAGPPDEGDPPVPVAREVIGERSLRFMQGSLVGGLAIALATLAALFACSVRLARRRDLARLVPLAVPVLALIGQLYFAIRFPYDTEGVVKGAYLVFAAAPLCALFGVAVAWLSARRPRRWLAIVPLAGLLAVAGYSLHARRLLLRAGPPGTHSYLLFRPR